MIARGRSLLAALTLAALAGCGGSRAIGADAGPMAPRDGGTDGGADAGPDAGGLASDGDGDGGPDAGADAGNDAGVLPTCAAPTFSLPAGSYAGSQTVSLLDTTAGAALIYTLDGTTPTSTSSLYAGPLTLTSTVTVTAIATAATCSPSPASSAAYALGPAPDAEEVTVDASDIWVDVERQPIGINSDWFVDADANRGPGAVPLQNALSGLGITTLRLGGDDVIWSGGPVTLARYGSADDYPADWPPVSLDDASPDSFTNTPITQEQLVDLCEAIGCAPTVIVNHNAYLVSGPCAPPDTGPTQQELIDAAAAEVTYMNVTHNHGVRFWEIGNESWQVNQACNGLASTAAQYAADVPRWSSAMKAKDPTILVGANWNGYDGFVTILQAAASSVDFLVYHNYGYYLDFADYQAATDLTSGIYAAESAIGSAGLGAADQARLKIAVNETNMLNFTSGARWPDHNDLSHALGVFELLFQTLAYHPKVSFVDLWATHWPGATPDPYSAYDALTNTNGPTPIATVLGLTVATLQSKIVGASESNDQLVRPYATYDQYRGRLNVFLVNKDTSAHAVNLNLESYTAASPVVATQVFMGAGIDDYAPTLTAGLATTFGGAMTVTVPALSLTVLSLAGQSTGGLNVVQNGSFELPGAASWTPSGSVSIRTPNSFDGDNAYTLFDGGCISQTVPVVGGGTYRVSAEAVATAGSGTLDVNGDHGLSLSLALGGASYTETSWPLAIPTEDTSATLSICAPAGGTLIVDDVVLARP